MARESTRQALSGSLCMCVCVLCEERERKGEETTEWADWLSVPLTGETEWREVKDDHASKKGK